MKTAQLIGIALTCAVLLSGCELLGKPTSVGVPIAPELESVTAPPGQELPVAEEGSGGDEPLGSAPVNQGTTSVSPTMGATDLPSLEADLGDLNLEAETFE